MHTDPGTHAHILSQGLRRNFVNRYEFNKDAIQQSQESGDDPAAVKSANKQANSKLEARNSASYT